MSELLHLGCGRDIKEGWVNVDHPATVESIIVEPTDEVVGCDLDAPGLKLPFPDDTFTQVECSHTLEHIVNILPLMEEVHRVCKNDAKFYAAVPYGSSDDAYEDPTHVRQFFAGSWHYFSQPTYWRSDYGYRGDWKPLGALLYVDELRYPGGEQQTNQVLSDVITLRNVVREMRAVLQAVKPARKWSDAEEMDTWETRVVFVPVSEQSPEVARREKISQSEMQQIWTP